MSIIFQNFINLLVPSVESVDEKSLYLSYVTKDEEKKSGHKWVKLHRM